jgi:hypothetical protein
MDQHTPAIELIEEDQTLWHTDRGPAGCVHCHRVFLVPPDYRGVICPICRKGALEAQPVIMRPSRPERVLPFQVTKQDLLPIYQQFVSGVWIKPADFNPETLLKNTRPIFWPLWLVDSDINGGWQMEAGFDYQVESSKEVFAGGGWQSRVQIENRVRWQLRVGTLTNHVDNVVTPALEEHDNRQRMTGAYQLEQGKDFDPHLLGGAFLELPDIPPEDAWPLARPNFDQTLAQICRKAAGAQHLRNFSMKADFSNQNWTEFFLPIYATHYTDDEGNPQVLVVNGQTGAIHGPRLASRQRGGHIAGIIAAIAGGLFMLAMIALLLTMVLPWASIIAVFLGVLGFGAVIFAILTAVWPGQWNRNQVGPRIADKK